MKVKVENNRIVPINNNQNRFNTFLEHYNNSGKVLNLYFDEVDDDITVNQIRFFKAICNKVVETTGENYYQIEKHFLKYLPKRFINDPLFKNNKIEKIIPLEELSKKEFDVFLLEVIDKARDFFNIQIDFEGEDKNHKIQIQKLK